MAEQRWITGSAHAEGGSRHYKLWVPATLDKAAAAPLLLFLHGCTHGPDEMAEISGMNAVAEANRFLVAYPEQTRFANLLKCWNWFNPKHQSRNNGEPSILAAIVAQVCIDQKVDPDRIFVAGVSAGGAMAVIAAATYPDLFGGIAVVAGGEFKAATGVTEALSVLKHGGPDPARQGQAAFEAMRDGLARRNPRRMPVIVFHGTEDDKVNPIHADQVIAQWSKTNACLAAHHGENGFSLSDKIVDGRVPQGHSYQQHVYTDQAGRLLMEKWIVEGLGHAWPGSPHAGAYADPKGPNASAEIWRFFTDAGSR